MRTLGVYTSGARLTTEASNLLSLVMFAYNLKNYQIAGSVPLLTVGDQRFGIVAKAEGDGPRTKDEFRQMMQLLLADRFKLTAHREMREIPVYALVVAKNGPKLKESVPDADPTAHFGANGRNTLDTLPKATIDDIVGAISSSRLDRPVIDKTGLTGTYNVRLEYTDRTPVNRAADPDPNEISIFTAVEQQLGLRLEAQKAMIEIFVIDHAEKPGEN